METTMKSPGGNSSPGGTKTMNRSFSSSGTLRKSGQAAITNGEDGVRIPGHLSTTSLTARRKLNPSTGNLHGFITEDYQQVKWPLPKAFGQEKYGFSLIDIEDPRYVKECAGMSQKLIRLSYDQQIIDQEWRKTYKSLLDAEHRQATLPMNCPDWRKQALKKEVDNCMKHLLELQEQKDIYEQDIQDVYNRCDAIKASIKKEEDLEALRSEMEAKQKERVGNESVFWRTKFNIRSATNKAPGHGGVL